MMTTHEPRVETLLGGRYELQEMLGKGGFGTVWRGHDTRIGRTVAIKKLHVTNEARSAETVAELRERFRREASAAGRIRHPNVVTIYDIDVADDEDEVFIVMEYLEGRELYEHVVRFGPLDVARALRLFVPCLEALGKGHALGIVHKDLKPQNLFLCDPDGPEESLRIVDFGVARVLHEEKLTLTGLIVGTPQYFAPEYITQMKVTPALDVYQMGLILVEALTGQPAVPYDEKFVACCNRHFNGDLDIPEYVFDGPLGEVLRKALARDWEQRYATATEFAEALAALESAGLVEEYVRTMVFHRKELGPAAYVPTLDGTPPEMTPPQRLSGGLFAPITEEEAARQVSESTSASQEGATPSSGAGTDVGSRPEVQFEWPEAKTSSGASEVVARRRALWPLVALLVLAVGAVSFWFGRRAEPRAVAPPTADAKQVAVSDEAPKALDRPARPAVPSAPEPKADASVAPSTPADEKPAPAAEPEEASPAPVAKERVAEPTPQKTPAERTRKHEPAEKSGKKTTTRARDEGEREKTRKKLRIALPEEGSSP